MRLLTLGLADGRQASSIDAAIEHHLNAGGRRFRAALCLSVSSALGLRACDALCLASACELLHNASLIHDDLQDGDRIRRGHETVWSRFGEDVAICAGDLLVSAAYSALSEVSAPAKISSLVRLAHERIAEAIHGQVADLSYQQLSLADIDSYEQVAVAKSGSLLSLPMELPLRYADNPGAAATARSAAHAFAVGYQIADDLDDVERDSGVDGRAAGLNAVLVLRAAGYHSSAEHRATARAIACFKTSIERSRVLPNHCGRELTSAAAKLSKQLRGIRQ